MTFNLGVQGLEDTRSMKNDKGEDDEEDQAVAGLATHATKQHCILSAPALTCAGQGTKSCLHSAHGCAAPQFLSPKP